MGAAHLICLFNSSSLLVLKAGCGIWLYQFLIIAYPFTLGSWMTTYLGKSCSFGFSRVPFVNCRRFMYLVISLLVLRAGCGIWLYQFLIIAYLFTLIRLQSDTLDALYSLCLFDTCHRSVCIIFGLRPAENENGEWQTDCLVCKYHGTDPWSRIMWWTDHLKMMSGKLIPRYAKTCELIPEHSTLLPLNLILDAHYTLSTEKQ